MNLARDLNSRIGGLRSKFGEIGDTRLTVMAAITVADELAEAALRIKRLEEELTALQDARVTSSDRSKAAQASIAAALSAAAARVEDITKKLNQTVAGSRRGAGIAYLSRKRERSTREARRVRACLRSTEPSLPRPHPTLSRKREREPRAANPRLSGVGSPSALHWSSRGCPVRRRLISGALRSSRELSLALPLGLVTWRPPTYVGSRDRTLTAGAAPHLTSCLHSSPHPLMSRKQKRRFVATP